MPYPSEMLKGEPIRHCSGAAYLQNRAALAVVSLKVLRLCCKELQRPHHKLRQIHVQAAWELEMLSMRIGAARSETYR